jgi:hypothetical protein
MRRLFSIVLSALFIALAQAASADDAKGPLAPGKAAGLQSAQTDDQLGKLGVAAGVGLGAVALYFILGTNYHVSGHHSGHASSGTH